MCEQVHLQQPKVIRKPAGWLARIAGPTIQPVLQDQTNTHTHIATASARSPLQVAQTTVQAHVPYARRRPRHRAIAHYASNLCKQFTHHDHCSGCTRHVSFVPSRHILLYTRRPQSPPPPSPPTPHAREIWPSAWRACSKLGGGPPHIFTTNTRFGCVGVHPR